MSLLETNFDASIYNFLSGVCPQNCPDACLLSGQLEKGELVKLNGDKSHPITKGFLCVKAKYFIERVYHPDRLLNPMKRVGPKGSGQFERISWDTAISEISEKFKSIKNDFSGESILRYSFSGTLGKINNEGMDRRFFHRLGASQLLRTICTAAGDAGYLYTVGRRVSSDIETIRSSSLIILWGHNAVETSSHTLPLIKEARDNGASLIVIDPRYTPTAKIADWHIAPKPGTDLALALTMMNVIINERLYNKRYVEKHTYGFGRLNNHIQKYSIEWASSITGISAQDIRLLAHRYALEKPSFIRCGWGLQRHTNGGMAVRAITCLPGLIGSWEIEGGGMFLSNSAAIRLNYDALQRPDLLQGEPRSINMVQLADVLSNADPPLKGLHVYNSNPVAVAPDQQRVIQGLSRNDLFVVVHEIFQTDTADYADILIPATTQFEEWDIIQPHGTYLAVNKPMISPRGEAKSNTEVFRLLAKAMGFQESCFDDDDLSLIEQLISSDDPNLRNITLESLLNNNWVRADLPYPYLPFVDGDFGTPTGKIELFSTQMEEQGLPPLPEFEPIKESPEVTPKLYNRYPLIIISPTSRYTVSSSYANIAFNNSPETKPTVYINTADAKDRAISNGSSVELFNDRGNCFLWACVTDETPPGVIVSKKARWAKKSPMGKTINQLTSTRLSDLGGGATYHSTLVEIKPFSG